jgi:hypothetical protein
MVRTRLYTANIGQRKQIRRCNHARCKTTGHGFFFVMKHPAGSSIIFPLPLSFQGRLPSVEGLLHGPFVWQIFNFIALFIAIHSLLRGALQ